MIDQFFKDLFKNHKIGILGFGREGISSYKTLRKYLSDAEIFIFDQSELSPEKEQILASDNRVEIFEGKNYLDSLFRTDIVVKSPGIPTMHIEDLGYQGTIISQADIFLKLFKDKAIGITGTKGKSTTASLLHHILVSSGRKPLLAGNIGVPPFEIIDEVSSDTIVVLELSIHQLENCTYSPHISVLLNLFEEHLDHYRSYSDYQLAKGNIFKFQMEKDFIIADLSNKEVSGLVKAIGSESALID
ncbi:MAG: hypothetical protein EOM23_06665, partial [Candidatus Moranbacteria bacterium]|nr:hypothetical protein [Candidatus Moranbacteria bacterium]